MHKIIYAFMYIIYEKSDQVSKAKNKTWMETKIIKICDAGKRSEQQKRKIMKQNFYFFSF